MERLEYIKELYSQYLAKNISKQDQKELMKFFNTCNDTELQYIVGSLDPDEQIIESELQRYGQRADDVLDRIRKKTATKDRFMEIHAVRKWLTIAATALLIGFAGYYLYKVNTTPDQPTVTTSIDDIPPGGNRATLTFSDGQTLTLSEDKEGIDASDSDLTYTDGEELRTGSEPISYATLTTPRGGQYQITLPDGSRVWLNAASSLRYPGKFHGHERKVTLEGEAYFEVTRDEDRPFIVESKGQHIEVLGTEFNINAYKDEPRTLTTLVQGSVRLHTTGEGTEVILKPGEQAAVTGGTVRVAKVEPGEYTTWRKGQISLNQADLSAIIRQIERWYDVQFDIEYMPLSEPLFGVLKRDVQLSEILEALELHYQVKFKRNGRRITMTR